jgi:hypothetical protein
MRPSLSIFSVCALLAASLLGASGCSDGSLECPAVAPAGGLPLLGADCDPMVPTQCGFPFPSNVYTKTDASTPTGLRVEFGPTTLPIWSGGGHMKTDPFATKDGFSAGQPPMTHMPGATVTGLPTQDTIDVSLTNDSPTILMEADTGALVPHFAELDMSLAVDEERTFMIRPVVRLKDATRYIVAIRHVVDASGKALAPSPVFQALRDGAESCEASVGRREELYADIFGKLEKAGISRKDLQIAWDYTTASRENNTSWLLHMRDDALATVGPDGPMYSIISYEDDPNPNIKRRILGKMTVPLYLTEPGPGGRLVFGDDGLPKQNGTADYEFLVHIPHAATMGTPGVLLQNGHGLLGTKDEGRNGYLAEIANRKNFVAFGVDLVGMAEDDFSTVADAIATDAGGFQASIDRQHQGIVNSLLAMRLMKGRFVNEPLAALGPNGTTTIDPSECYYRGDSQGGIFGVTYMAVSTDVTRGLLGEPGMPYSLLLNRSVDFSQFFLVLKGSYRTGLNIQLLQGLLQMMWDRTEPNGYAPYIVENMLPGTPSHEVLLHVAIGDYQVTPLGAHIIARTVKAKSLSPANRSLWGIEEAASPFMGSGIVEFGFGLPEAPKTNTPPVGPSGDDPHDKVRVLDAAYDQTDTFFRTGTIQAYCMGPCDPE